MTLLTPVKTHHAVAIYAGILLGGMALNEWLSEPKHDPLIACATVPTPERAADSPWRVGDCVASKFINGKPAADWTVLKGQYDDGGWYGDLHFKSGNVSQEWSASEYNNKRFECEVVQ